MKDVFSLSAFPKSGVTYLSFLMFHSLFSDDCDIRDLESRYIIDIHGFPQANFADLRAPHIIKSHFRYSPHLPFVERTAKAVYLLRHPIDVMMSAWDFKALLGAPVNIESQQMAFRAYVRRWVETGGTDFPEFIGSWVNHVRSWLGQTNIPVHLVTYRNLVDRPHEELAAILNFLGIDVSEAQRHRAIERSSMKAMAAFEEKEVDSGKDGVFFRKGLTIGHDQGHRFVNKGYRDSYQTVLTDEERKIADQTFAEGLALLRRAEA